MGKTRDLFKKIRDTKGKFHAKMGLIKDRNGMDLTEAEDIKRWQEYTEELYKKDLHDLDNHDGVITYLEPDILECAGSSRPPWFRTAQLPSLPPTPYGCLPSLCLSSQQETSQLHKTLTLDHAAPACPHPNQIHL